MATFGTAVIATFGVDVGMHMALAHAGSELTDCGSGTSRLALPEKLRHPLPKLALADSGTHSPIVANIAGAMSVVTHSLPTNSAPMPPDVRSSSNSDHPQQCAIGWNEGRRQLKWLRSSEKYFGFCRTFRHGH
jgi:hypothetical protein